MLKFDWLTVIRIHCSKQAKGGACRYVAAMAGARLPRNSHFSPDHSVPHSSHVYPGSAHPVSMSPPSLQVTVPMPIHAIEPSAITGDPNDSRKLPPANMEAIPWVLEPQVIPVFLCTERICGRPGLFLALHSQTCFLQASQIQVVGILPFLVS